jgi:L-malate glycosyltransferase
VRIVYVAWNGAVHTQRWARFFADRGHEVHVVTCGDGDRSVGYAVHDLGRPRGGKAGYLLKLPRARRVVRSLEPDLVHAHYATSYGLLGAAAGRRPFVVTAHGDDLLISPRNPVMRLLVRRVLLRADLVTVPSEPMRAAAAAVAGGGALPVDVFQYGVETERLVGLAAETRASASPGPLSIVSARPLLRLYRIADLVGALALLRDRGLDFRCTIAGAGPEREALEARATGLGLGERVRFTGAIASDQVEGLLARADVAVSVAESDGASVALLESLALGAVPVVSDIPANRAWVTDGANGVVVGIAPEAIADGIERAAQLDREAVAAANAELVRARADRTRNLGRLEGRLEELVREARAGRLEAQPG